MNPSHIRENILAFLMAWNPDSEDWKDFQIEEVLLDESDADRLHVTLGYDRPRKFTLPDKLAHSSKVLQIMDREAKIFIVQPSTSEVLGMKKATHES